MMHRVHRVRSALARIQGKRDRVTAELLQVQQELEQLADDVATQEQARVVIQSVAQRTQEELQYHISELATLALSSVFPDPYELAVRFECKRGKTEAQISFVKDGRDINPLTATGGGAVDIAALALRFSLLTLHTPALRRVVLLDEPLKWLKGDDLPEKGAQLISEISHRLGVQVIMVSHDPELIGAADRVFRVGQKKGISYIQAD